MSNQPLYLSLKTAAKRLDYMRIEARKLAFAADRPAAWREIRTYGFHNWAINYGDMSQGSNSDKTQVWTTFTGEQFRNERFADDCENAPSYVKENNGWFSDNDQNETVRGIVANLTHGRFIAGYYWSNNGERVYFGDVYTDESEAARAADRHAEVYAEVCRDDDEQYQAARKLEDDNETALQRLRECATIRNNPCFDYVRSEIADLVETIRTNREALRTTYAQYV